MDITLRAPGKETVSLANFWEQYFKETPMCSHEGCLNVAHEVDPFFPYLDDLNRCGEHTSGLDHQPALS
ncbi:MAG: hypothetical protein OEW39_01725 [Deltaproteobacteria bacterium]|nr:hypothetical protein [Deltaproteobacteria bacterium]